MSPLLTDCQPSHILKVSNLQYSHAVQQVMSKEKTPVLAGAVPSLERFMSNWERLAAIPDNKHLAPAIERGLSFAKKYYKRMDDTDAYVIAMCEYYNFRYT
jgi:hypothetical protein